MPARANILWNTFFFQRHAYVLHLVFVCQILIHTPNTFDPFLPPFTPLAFIAPKRSYQNVRDHDMKWFSGGIALLWKFDLVFWCPIYRERPDDIYVWNVWFHRKVNVFSTAIEDSTTVILFSVKNVRLYLPDSRKQVKVWNWIMPGSASLVCQKNFL